MSDVKWGYSTKPEVLREALERQATYTTAGWELKTHPDDRVDFDLSHTGIVVLPKISDEVLNLRINHNELTSLDGVPSRLEWLNCSYNPGLKTLDGLCAAALQHILASHCMLENVRPLQSMLTDGYGGCGEIDLSYNNLSGNSINGIPICASFNVSHNTLTDVQWLRVAECFNASIDFSHNKISRLPAKLPERWSVGYQRRIYSLRVCYNRLRDLSTEHITEASPCRTRITMLDVRHNPGNTCRGFDLVYVRQHFPDALQVITDYTAATTKKRLRKRAESPIMTT